MKEYKDKANRRVKVGDYIVYGHALGRCAGLQYGKVIALTESKTESYNHEREGSLKIKVQGVDTNYELYPPRLLKPSFLQFSERLLVITKSQLPKNVLQLLKEVK